MNQYLTDLYGQIGNGTFFMLGAYNKQYSDKENYLSFRIKGSRKCNYIKITYNIGMDDYDMRFSKIVKFEEKNIVELESVYFDQLHELIREHTGLETTMPRIIFCDTKQIVS